MPFSSAEEMQGYILREQNLKKLKELYPGLNELNDKKLDIKILKTLPIYLEVPINCNPEDNKDLYFIRQKGTNIYKIGMSNNPESRLKTLDMATPHELELFLVVKNGGYLEMDFHIFFSPYNIKNEWFEITIENIVECISKSLIGHIYSPYTIRLEIRLENQIKLLEYQIAQYRALILDEEDEDSFLYY